MLYTAYVLIKAMTTSSNIEERLTAVEIKLAAMDETYKKDKMDMMTKAMSHMDDETKVVYKTEIKEDDNDDMKVALATIEDEDPKKDAANITESKKQLEVQQYMGQCIKICLYILSIITRQWSC